jgi:hypothetical protein
MASRAASAAGLEALPGPARQEEQFVARKAKKKDAKVAGLLGLGLDNQDGHRRITRGEEFLLVGGSQETHEHMQDVAIRITESLQQKGKRLQDAAPQEVVDLIRKALDR